MVGDHEPPVVRCTEGVFTSGSVRVTAFQAPIPDALAVAVVTDNVTQVARLLLSQQPTAGTMVGQGTHPVTVSATDEAGNTGRCTVYFVVQSAVTVTSIPSYSVFTEGTPIPVELGYGVDTGEVAETRVYVDGQLHHVVSGPLTEPLTLTSLGPGVHGVHVVIANAAGDTSTSRSRVFTVTPPPSLIEADLSSPDQETLTLHYQAAGDRLCCLQVNETLDEETWETVHAVDGHDQPVEFHYPIESSPLSRAYFRVLYIEE
jgi:hypothetical protein